MSAFDELMRAAQEEKTRRESLKHWEKLKEKILYETDPNAIIELQKEIDIFMGSDAPNEDKEHLSGYLECYYMKLDAVLPEGILGAGVFGFVKEME